MATRYDISLGIQPVRKISKASTDIYYQFKQSDRVDKLAGIYYKDATLGWLIMLANPQYFHEFQIPNGAQLRIPFPLSRVWAEIGSASNNDI